MLDFLTSIYGFSTLFAATERSEGENRWAVLRMRSPDPRSGAGPVFHHVTSHKQTQKLNFYVINTCNICNMCTAKQCDLIFINQPINE